MTPLLLATILLAAQDDAQKIDDWVAEQSKDPGAPDASRLYYLKALEATLKGIPDAAEYGYGKALELDPEFAAAANGRGFAYLRAQKPDRAAEWLQKDAERFPDDWAILHNLGTAYFAQKKFEDAVRWYDRAGEKAGHPRESAESRYGKGSALAQLKKWEEALKALGEALTYDALHEAARELFNRIQAYLWRKSPPKVDLSEYVSALKLHRADALSLAQRIPGEIERYLTGVDRIMVEKRRDLRTIHDALRRWASGNESAPDPKFDPGCQDKPLGSAEDRCAVRENLELLKLIARDLGAWAWTFGPFASAAGLAYSAPDEWFRRRGEFEKALKEIYIPPLEKHAKRLGEILAIAERVTAKPDDAGIEEVANAFGEVPLMARMILMWRRWMEISTPALQGVWDSLLTIAERLQSEEPGWIRSAHELHRKWHGGKVGNELALKRLCEMNEGRCDRIHWKIEDALEKARRRAEQHSGWYRDAHARDVRQIDLWWYSPFVVRGDYKGLYDYVAMTRGSVETMGALGGFTDAHMWGGIGELMMMPKLACYVCSHACGHKNYEKIRYLPFDITFSLCGTFTFKFGGKGELELKMGRGLFGSVYFNPGTLEYGARVGAEIRGLDLLQFRDATNPDYYFIKELQRMPVMPGRARGFAGQAKDYLRSGKKYWIPREWRKMAEEKPSPKWTCGVSLSVIPSVYVDFKFSPEGNEVNLMGKIRYRAEGAAGPFAAAAGPSMDPVPIWHIYASPPREGKR